MPNTYYTEVGNIAHLEQYLSEFAIKNFQNFFRLYCAPLYDGAMEDLSFCKNQPMTDDRA